MTVSYAVTSLLKLSGLLLQELLPLNAGEVAILLTDGQVVNGKTL